MFGEGHGVLGTWLFTHMFDLLRLGRKKPLVVEDFPEIVECDKPEVISERTLELLEPVLIKLKEREMRNSENYHSSFGKYFKRFFTMRQPSVTSLYLWWVLIRVHWRLLLPPMLFKLLGDICSFIPILCMKYLLISLTKEEENGEDDYLWSIRKGYFYSVGLFFAYVLVTLFLQQHHSLVIRTAIIIKYSIVKLLFKQSMAITATSKQKAGGSGRLTTLISTDAEAVERAIRVGNYLWTAPIIILIAIILLYREIQWAVVGGIITMIVLLFFQTRLGKFQSKLRTKALSFTDSRISLLTQVFIGIRVWKLNGWEERFGLQVTKEREVELKSIRKIALATAFASMVAASVPTLITLSVFSVFAATSPNPLTVSTAFTSLSLFSLMKYPLWILPSSYVDCLNACAALDRIYEFLKADKLPNLPLISSQPDENNVVLLNGDFYWDYVEKEKGRIEEGEENMITIKDNWMLKDINISIKRNKLTLIVGKVGVGKSTLLHSILGETHSTNEIYVYAKNIALCSQQPWIFNATLRENILFHNDFDEERYDQVIEACALKEDLKILKSGDMTEIGEHGINLSGGQQARISLARAVYSDAELYLLDDIFSAVDANVANQILKNCILGPLLQNKTCVLVTHKLEYLDSADWIIMLESQNDNKSSVLIQGTPEDLKQCDYSFVSESDTLKSYKSENNSEKNIIIKANNLNNDSIKQDETESRLTDKEERETGSVKLKIFFGYMKAFGLIFVACAFFILFVQVATNLTLYWWLSLWSTDAYGANVWFYIKYYALLCAISVIAISIFETIWGVGAFYASKGIHKDILNAIIKAPVSFFNATPTGRILNRFSQDISCTDYNMAKSVSNVLSQTGAMLGVIILLCILLPYLIFLFVPFCGLYWYMQRFYSSSSREIRRLDKITKSPIYSYFEESQSGISTIRAYQQEILFSDAMDILISTNQTIYWTSHQINRWLALRLETLGGFIAGVVSFLGVFMSYSLGAGYVGLMISQALSLSNLLNWTIRWFVDLESQLTSIERLLHYINNTPKEESDEIKERYIIPPESWPNEGRIEFDSVNIRYREELSLVLRDFSIKVNQFEKIGICGRTGAGKSSLILCLFRIMELESGRILIDDIDISTIPLSILRNKLSIIPQSPLLFPGTIRTNLDPFNSYSDVEIWNALEQVTMKEYISSQKDKLESSIVEWGDNFSTGQRQLLCLARAILKKAVILVLDEATASVDPETDQLIQNAIKNVFKNCTILTIAHRLSSIIDSDRIITLDQGTIIESGQPSELLKDNNSEFCKMLNSTINNQ